MERIIATAVSMVLIDLILTYLQKRDDTKGTEGDDAHYTVQAPAVLSSLYRFGFWFGVFLFSFFLFFYLKGNPTVEKGHLYFALAFSGICLLVVLGASRWRIQVCGDKMVIIKLFRKPFCISLDNISKAEIGKKGQMILYGENRKKIVTVDGLSDNYSRLEKTVKNAGKLRN